MRSFLLVSLVSLVPSVALAWTHSGTVVGNDHLPLRVSIQAEPQIPGMTPEQVGVHVERALQAWADASCGVQVEYLGERSYDDPTEAPEGDLHLVFSDLGDNGAPWLRLGPAGSGEILFQREGRSYRRERLGPYAVNTAYGLVTDERATDGSCRSEVALSTFVGVLLGERLGLGRSSEVDALMSPRLRACSVRRPSADDAEGLDDLYGPWVFFDCESSDPDMVLDDEVAGVVPFDVACEIGADAQSTVTGASWSWGDGERSEGVSAEHTYTTTGNLTLRATVSGEHATCGDFQTTYERFGYVRACGEPNVDFSIERYRGLVFQTINDSNVQTYGCHTAIDWRVYNESEQLITSVQAWEPRLAFPEDGTYRIELELTGPGGTAVDQVWLDTRTGSVRGYTLGSGCSKLGAVGPWALPALLVLLRRRRR